MKHHPAVRGLHWLMAVMIAAAYFVILRREGMDDPDQRALWLDIHRSIGLGVLALVACRIVVRWLFGRDRPVDASLPLWERAAAAISHGLLYLAMIGLPLLGWLLSSANSRHFKLFDVQLPSLVAKNADQADLFEAWHTLAAWALAGVLAIHLAGALYHRLIRKDHVLQSMI